MRTGEVAGLKGPFWIAAASRLAALMAILLIPFSHAGVVSAASPQTAPNAQVIPDWLSPGTADQLSVGIDVLLPEVVPAPFDGEPAVEASAGYYSLYWLIPGTPPTYLQITGQAGGTIPDYSAYDRNVQLQQNAEVQGYPAYHDLTPVYDLVYWQVGDVVYSVESQGLSDTDSLSLANSLSLLATGGTAPEGTPGNGSGGDGSGDGGNVPADASITIPGSIASGDTITVDVANVDSAILTASSGTFTATGSNTYENVSDGSYEWQAPSTVEDLFVRFVLVDPNTQDWITSAEVTITGTHTPPSTTLDCPSPVNSGDLVTISLSGGGTIVVNASNGYFPVESPNTDFAPDADGSGTITGTLLAGASVELNLQAPEVTSADAIFVYVSDTDGVTNAQCEINILAPDQPATTPNNGDKGNESLPNAPPSGNGGNTDQPPIKEAPTEELPTPNQSDTQADSHATASATKENDASIVGDGTGDSGEVIQVESVSTAKAPTKTAKATNPSKRTATPEATVPAPPSPTPREIKTPRPSPTSSPVVSSNGMVAQVIGPEGGQLTHPSGATIIIPPGALTEKSTVTIIPVADTSLPVTDRIDFVPATGFDITISGSTGKPVETLAKAAALQLTIAPDKWRRETTLYSIVDGSPQQVNGTQLSDRAVSASIGHLSRYAAGVPIKGDQKRNWLIYAVAAGAIVLFIVVTGFGISSARRRGVYSVGPRRVPERNRRR